MKLENVRSAYEALSGKTSDIVRQMSLAGVGLIWIFKSGTGPLFMLDSELLKAALFIFVALFCDFLQYLVGTIIWVVYFRYKEGGGTTESDEFLAPPKLNWPLYSLFYVKSGMMIVAYGCYLIPFLVRKFGI